jgi:glycosyltransferase involved in cell wall biosynthesis
VVDTSGAGRRERGPVNAPHDPLPPPPRRKQGWPWTVAEAAGASTSARSPRSPAADATVWPRISIVTPSYNQGHFIEETIRSVLQQGYPNLEYIVMDGRSTDASVAIIERYSRWLHDWVSEPDLGQSDAINRGFARSTGQILGWLNSDDYLAPGALHKVAAVFREHPTVGAVVGIGHKVDAAKRIIYSPLPPEITKASLFGWCSGHNFMQPACFFSRSAWTTCGPLRLDLDYCMDLALWFDMTERYEFKTLRESLAFINTHGEAKTVKERAQMFGEIALLMAAQPGGWEAGRKLLFKTLSERADSRALTTRMGNRIRKVWRR